MADYLLTKVEVSSDEEFENKEVMNSISKADLDFINDDDSVGDDIDFYRVGRKSRLQIWRLITRPITRPWPLFSRHTHFSVDRVNTLLLLINLLLM